MEWKSVADGIAQARREMSARERRDVTGEEIAKAVGVTSAAYSRWENGERTPNEAAVQKLAAFFGVSPAYLRYGDSQASGVLDRVARAERKPASELVAKPAAKKPRGKRAS